MLIEFKVKNFRSFRDEQVLSMVPAQRDHTLGDQVISETSESGSETSLLRQVAVYGPNASGKSNLVKAFRFLKSFIVDSFQKNADDPTGAVPFFLNSETRHMPSRFQITFVHEKVKYEYAIALDIMRVVEESLAAYPTGHRQHWFLRKWTGTQDNYEWSFPGHHVDASLKDKTLMNKSFLSVCSQFNVTNILKAYRWFSHGIDIIDLSAAKDELDITPYYDTARAIHESREVKNFVLSMLKSSDLGIVDLEVEKDDVTPYISSNTAIWNVMPSDYQRKIKARISYRVNLIHQSGNGGNSTKFNFFDESAGTRRLFSLLAPWARAAFHDRCLIIDEIDASMHPHLIRHLVVAFSQFSRGDHSGQIIFTTHDTTLMDRRTLRRDQIWITEKVNDGSSRLIPLTDYSPRMNESIQKNYLHGMYGGIPIIDDMPIAEACDFPIEFSFEDIK